MPKKPTNKLSNLAKELKKHKYEVKVCAKDAHPNCTWCGTNDWHFNARFEKDYCGKCGYAEDYQKPESLEDFKERVKEPGSDGNYVTQRKDGTSFWESTRKWAEAKQAEKPLESTQCKDGNPDCVCGEELKPIEDWEKDEFSVAVNIYGNECIRVALDSIKNCITDEERMIEWKSAAYRLIDLHKSLLSQQAKEVREDQERIDAEIAKNTYRTTDPRGCRYCIDGIVESILSTNKES